jgi:hypothetical protein
MKRIELELLPGVFAVCRLSPDDTVPDWVLSSPFFNVTRSTDELSVVCDESRVPANTKADRGWQCLRVKGPFALTESGILASLTQPLASANISIFAISTFDTDYLLIKEQNLAAAISVLKAIGHQVTA